MPQCAVPILRNMLKTKAATDFLVDQSCGFQLLLWRKSLWENVQSLPRHFPTCQGWMTSKWGSSQEMKPNYTCNRKKSLVVELFACMRWLIKMQREDTLCGCVSHTVKKYHKIWHFLSLKNIAKSIRKIIKIYHRLIVR